MIIVELLVASTCMILRFSYIMVLIYICTSLYRKLAWIHDIFWFFHHFESSKWGFGPPPARTVHITPGRVAESCQGGTRKRATSRWALHTDETSSYDRELLVVGQGQRVNKHIFLKSSWVTRNLSATYVWLELVGDIFFNLHCFLWRSSFISTH